MSKNWIDVAVLREGSVAERMRCDRAPAELRKLARALERYEPQGVVLEATGGLEAPVIAALRVAGMAVIRVNPKRARDFARAKGLLAKTDAVDAYGLALFGACLQPEVRAWPEPEREELSMWMTRLAQLTAQRACERTRLQQTAGELRRSVERVIKALSKEMERVEQHIEELVEASPAMQREQELLKSAPGVGEKIAQIGRAHV